MGTGILCSTCPAPGRGRDAVCDNGYGGRARVGRAYSPPLPSGLPPVRRAQHGGVHCSAGAGAGCGSKFHRCPPHCCCAGSPGCWALLTAAIASSAAMGTVYGTGNGADPSPGCPARRRRGNPGGIGRAGCPFLVGQWGGRALKTCRARRASRSPYWTCSGFGSPAKKGVPWAEYVGKSS